METATIGWRFQTRNQIVGRGQQGPTFTPLFLAAGRNRQGGANNFNEQECQLAVAHYVRPESGGQAGNTPAPEMPPSW
eukprot:11210845-Lingulodinium_polyedra.AAC.1